MKKKKKNKKWIIIKSIICIMTILISVYFVNIVKEINVLPINFDKTIVIIYLVINVLIVISLLLKNKIINIIGIVLGIITIIVSCIGIVHGNNIVSFFNKSFDNNKTEVTNYNVVVLKTSKYNKIKDLDNKIMGYDELDNNKEEYLSKIKDKIEVELKDYDDPYSLYEDLNKKKIDSIVISDGFLQVLEDDYEDINKNIKIIYNFEIKHKIKSNNKEIDELEPVNILISGSDSRSGKILTKTRSDVNMIMTIDPKKHKILLTSIPRDYYVQLHNTTGNKDKLTHAGIYGIDMTKETLEDVFNIKIDYTIKVGFQSVIQIVDLIGGIDIDSDLAFKSHCGDGGAIKTNVVKGINHFNGGEALSYARERYAYKEGDNHRVQNQQQVLEAIIEKISKDKSLLKKYDKLLESFSELYRTDIPSDYVKLIIKDQLSDMESWEIEKQQVKGEGRMLETYSMPGRRLWVMIPDMNSVDEARNNIVNMKNKK